MASPELFASREDADIERLIAQAPLAWVASFEGGEPMATPLPLMALPRSPGGERVLLGHFARSNPQVERLRCAPLALVLFLGPNAYVSPSWMADRTQAPTWNYACLQMRARIVFDDRPEAALEAVSLLSAAMEEGRANAWSPTEMGPRLERLARGVVAFRATVLSTQAKFKLGQDERDDVFADILKGLTQNDEVAVESWMRRYADRLAMALDV